MENGSALGVRGLQGLPSDLGAFLAPAPLRPCPQGLWTRTIGDTGLAISFVFIDNLNRSGSTFLRGDVLDFGVSGRGGPNQMGSGTDRHDSSQIGGGAEIHMFVSGAPILL